MRGGGGRWASAAFDPGQGGRPIPGHAPPTLSLPGESRDPGIEERRHPMPARGLP